MKNLEKFNAETTPLGTELITRDGREVSEWYYFKNTNEKFPIKAVICNVIEGFTKDGVYYDSGTESVNDLFIKPKVRELWVNVYCHPDGDIFLGGECSTKEEAIGSNVGVNYIKTIRITDEPE